MMPDKWSDLGSILWVICVGITIAFLCIGLAGCRKVPDPSGCGYGNGWRRDSSGKVVCQ